LWRGTYEKKKRKNKNKQTNKQTTTYPWRRCLESRSLGAACRRESSTDADLGIRGSELGFGPRRRTLRRGGFARPLGLPCWLGSREHQKSSSCCSDVREWEWDLSALSPCHPVRKKETKWKRRFGNLLGKTPRRGGDREGMAGQANPN